MTSTTVRPTHTGTSDLLRVWGPVLASAALLAVGISLQVDSVEAEDVVDGVAMLTFPLVGGLLLRRGAPRLVVAIFVATGLLTGLGFLAGGWADRAGSAGAQLLADASFVVTMTLLLDVLLLVFPDGRPPSRAWRPLLWLGWVVMTAGVAATLFSPGPVDEDHPGGPTNPWGLDAAAGALDVVEAAALVGFAVLAVLGLLSLVWRLRRAEPADRRRVAWFLGGATTTVLLFLLDAPLQGALGPVYGTLSPLVAIPAVPVAALVGWRAAP